MWRYAIKIATACVLAVASVFVAIALLQREAAQFVENPPKERPIAPESARNGWQTASDRPTLLSEAAPLPQKEPISLPGERPLPASAPPSPVAEAERPATIAAFQPPIPSATIEAPLVDSDYLILAKQYAAVNILRSKDDIIESLSSPRVRMTQAAVNTIFNTGIKGAFAKEADPNFKFDASSGDLKPAASKHKSTVKPINLYKIGASLGGEAYLCIEAAKLDCVKSTEADKTCGHPQKPVVQKCVAKALGSANALILSEFKQEAG